jgi:hypothetical protein
MKIKLTAHIHYCKWDWQDKGEFQIFYCRLGHDDQRTYVGEQEVEVEVPDNYDPRPQQIASLQRQRNKAMADYQKTVDEINERISKLQALEYKA